jgi:hypothetical protein
MKPAHISIIFAVLFFWLGSAKAHTLHVTDDTNINLSQPSQNNGASADVFVRNVGTGGERHGYVRFETSPILPNTPILSAILRIWVSQVATAGSIDLYVVTGVWTEATLNAAAQPGTEPTPFATVAVSNADQNSHITVDVTSVLQDWVNQTKPNFGIALLPNPAGVRVDIDSKENTGTSHPMELEVIIAPTQIQVPTDVSARVSRSVDQAIPDAKYTPISFDTVEFDTNSMFTATAPTKLTATTAGKYLVIGYIEFDTSFVGDQLREVTLRLNGLTRIARVAGTSSASFPFITTISTYYLLNAGDYVELVVRHGSGTTLNVHAPEPPALVMVKVP